MRKACYFDGFIKLNKHNTQSSRERRKKEKGGGERGGGVREKGESRERVEEGGEREKEE